MRLPRALRRLGTRLSYATASGRWWRNALLAVLGLCVLGAVWILVTGVIAARQAQRVESRLQEIRTLVAHGDIAQARREAYALPELARRAHRLTTGPAWWLAAQLPVVGTPIEVIRGTATGGYEVGVHGVPTLLDVATALDPATLRTSGDTIDLRPLLASAPRLGEAAATLRAAADEVSQLPRSSWLGGIESARAKFARQLDAISGYVDAAARAAQVLPTMLGDKRPQRYFIGLQNEAEMRGTGGLPGAFAIVVADHGKVSFTHFASDSVLLPEATKQAVPTGLDFGTDYKRTYGASEPTSSIQNSNVSPHFPYAAQIWARMWEKVGKEHVDGALALDPTVLAYFLQVTGPIKAAYGVTVSADDVVSFTQRDEYTMFADNGQRKAFLVSILKATSRQIIDGRGSAVALAQAMSRAGKEHRLLVWSSDPSVQTRLQETPYAGAIPNDDRPITAVIVNNAAAGKLDYYLSRSVNYQRSGCGRQRDVLVTIKLTNDAPASGLPPYVYTRLDRFRPAGVKQGDNRTLLDVYATPGAQLLSASLNGKPTTAAVEHDLGHPIYRMDLELPRGTTQTITLHLQEPSGSGAPLVWRQPGVTPLAVTVDDQHCG